MNPFHIMLVLFAIFSIVAFVLLIRWERRYFIHLGKGKSWLLVRLATIPIAIVTAGLVIIPVLNISGMVGLAVFYILLIAIAPIFWFIAHWIVGKFAQPPLNFQESAQVAGAPLVLAVVLTWAAHVLQPIAWSILRSTGKA